MEYFSDWGFWKLINPHAVCIQSLLCPLATMRCRKMNLIWAIPPVLALDLIMNPERVTAWSQLLHAGKTFFVFLKTFPFSNCISFFCISLFYIINQFFFVISRSKSLCISPFNHLCSFRQWNTSFIYRRVHVFILMGDILKITIEHTSYSNDTLVSKLRSHINTSIIILHVLLFRRVWVVWAASQCSWQ